MLNRNKENMQPQQSEHLKLYKEEKRSGIAEGQVRCNCLETEAIYFSEMPTKNVNLQKNLNPHNKRKRSRAHLNTSLACDWKLLFFLCIYDIRHYETWDRRSSGIPCSVEWCCCRPRNNPEECRSHLRSGSLKSRTIELDCDVKCDAVRILW
jgi:hypothetical protein